MLTSDELAAMRADVRELLPDTCTIRRATMTLAADGSISETWSDAVVGALCRIDPTTYRDERGVIAERESTRNRYIISVEWNADLRDGDRIVAGGVTYEVTNLHSDATLRLVKRAFLSKLQGA